MGMLDEYLKGNVIAGHRISRYHNDDSQERALIEALESGQGINVLSDETKASIPGKKHLIVKTDSGGTIGEDPSEDEVTGGDLYASVYEDAYNAIKNRKPFEYSASNDSTYQQYKRAAEKSGKLAMKDTIGQIAALNGGYASSYAQTAGQQMYQSALDNVDNMIPELYEIARQRYDNETAALQDRFDTAADAYEKWVDAQNPSGLPIDNVLDLNNALQDMLADKDYTGIGMAINALKTTNEDKVSILENRVLNDLLKAGDYEGIGEVVELLDLTPDEKGAIIESWVPAWYLDGTYDSLEEYEWKTGKEEAENWLKGDGNRDRLVQIVVKVQTGQELTEEEQEIYDMFLPYMDEDFS